MKSRWIAVALLGLGAAAGAGLTYVATRSGRPAGTSKDVPAARTTPLAGAQRSLAPSEVATTLTPEVVARAGIKVAPVGTARVEGRIVVPAVVEPNAYQQVVVSSLVGGRVTRVLADLGQRVRRGQTLAELYSPELTDAQRAYLSARASLQAHELELARIERLVELGSASRQELEQAHAEHTMLTTSVEGARSRLELLAMTDDQIRRLSSVTQMTSTTELHAPIEGTIIGRDANAGLNVQAASPLFTVANLSTVWVVGSLYEKDFPAVRVGTPVAITVSALPAATIAGTITYIDPQISTETRTARIRAQVGNPRGELRLGMYAQIEIPSRSAEAVPVVPKTALQTIGDRSVVYIADPGVPGRFVERAVQTGAEAGPGVMVVSGLKAGESIVTEGGFFLRGAH